MAGFWLWGWRKEPGDRNWGQPLEAGKDKGMDDLESLEGMQPCLILALQTLFQGFPCGTVVKSLPANAGDTGSSPGPGRSHMLWSN